jgi:hypothetical protein
MQRQRVIKFEIDTKGLPHPPFSGPTSSYLPSLLVQHKLVTMTVEAPTAAAAAAPAVEEVNVSHSSEDGVGERFLNALAKSFASQVTVTLVEQLAAAQAAAAEAAKAKEEEEAAAAAKANEEEEAKAKEAAETEQSQEEKKAKSVKPEDMMDELHKIDAVCASLCYGMVGGVC